MSYAEALNHDKTWWWDLNERRQSSAFAKIPRILLLKPNRPIGETV